MTFVALRAPRFSASAEASSRAAANRSARHASILPHLVGALLIATGLTVPDAVIHAKTFKFGMIVDNMRQRLLTPSD